MNDDELWQRKDRAERHLDRASYAAYIHAGILGVLGGFVLASQDTLAAHDLAVFAFVLTLAALGWGTSRKLLVAPILLLVLTVWLEFTTWRTTGSVWALFLLVLFGSLYARGILGALEWQRAHRALLQGRDTGAGA